MAQDIQITPTEGMPPVTTQTADTTTGNESSAIQPTPASQAAATGAIGAADATTTAQGNVAPALASELKQKAAAQDLIANNADAAAAEQAALIQAKQPEIDEARRLANLAEQRYEDHKFYNFWDHKSTGDKIIAKLAVGLTQFANSGLGRSGNETADSIQHAIDQDFAQQKANLYSKEQIAKWRKEGVKDVYEELQKELAALSMKQAKAHEAVAAKAQAMVERAGIAPAEAKQNVVTAQSNEAAQKFRLETAQRYEAHAQRSMSQKTGTQETSAKAGAPAYAYDAYANPLAPASNKEQANKVNNENSAAQQAYEQLQLLVDSFKSPINPLDDPKGAAAQLQSRVAAQTELKTLMPQMKGFTRLTSEDMKAFNDIVGGKLDAVTGFGVNRLLQLKESLRKQVASHLSAIGVNPSDENVTRVLDKQAAAKAPKYVPPKNPDAGVSAKDRTNIAIARARLKKNPNDATAKQYLELVGASP